MVQTRSFEGTTDTLYTAQWKPWYVCMYREHRALLINLVDTEGVEGGKAGNGIDGSDDFSFLRVLAGSSGFMQLSRPCIRFDIRFRNGSITMIGWAQKIQTISSGNFVLTSWRHTFSLKYLGITGLAFVCTAFRAFQCSFCWRIISSCQDHTSDPFITKHPFSNPTRHGAWRLVHISIWLISVATRSLVYHLCEYAHDSLGTKLLRLSTLLWLIWSIACLWYALLDNPYNALLMAMVRHILKAALQFM